MRYNWNKGLGSDQDLKIFGAALPYFRECTDELFVRLGGQLEKFEYMLNSMANHRIFIGASGRTQYTFSIIQYLLSRYSGYNGENRPNVYVIGKDANIPVNDPKIDCGIVVSGSSFTKPAVNAMETLTKERVKTFFLTYTDLGKAREEQKKEWKPSVWDHFVKQKGYRERVIFLPMRERHWKRKQKRATLAPEGTKFELCAFETGMAIGNYMRIFHSKYNKRKPTKIPIETVMNTLIDIRTYLEEDLQEQCYESRFTIANFIQHLLEIPHKKIVGFGVSDINKKCFTNRLTHCRHLGKGKEDAENRSVHIVTTPYSGFIGKNTMVINISRSGDHPYTSYISEKAMQEKAKEIYLNTCNRNPTIYNDHKIIYPPIISDNEVKGFKGDFGHLGIFVPLNAIIAQLARNMGLDEQELTGFHSRFG